MNKYAKDFTQIYSQMVHACEMIEKAQQRSSKPVLLPPNTLSSVTVLIDRVHGELDQFIAQFSFIEDKKSFSYDQVITAVRYFHRGLVAIEKIVRALFDCIITMSKNALEREMGHKSETVFHYQRQVIKKSIITDPYKDIILAVRYIEFSFDRGSGWMMTFPVGIDGLIEKIEKMEVEINFLIEGVTIVAKEESFSYFDIVLIMNRFHVGLSRMDMMIQAIKNMLVRAFVCMEDEQEREALIKQKKKRNRKKE